MGNLLAISGASLIIQRAERSWPGCPDYTEDQRTMRSILTTAPLEDCDRKIYRKPGFMFGDVAPDTDHAGQVRAVDLQSG